MNLTTLGIDLAKTSFSLVGMDWQGDLTQNFEAGCLDGVCCAMSGVLDRHGGLWWCTLLGERISKAGA